MRTRKLSSLLVARTLLILILLSLFHIEAAPPAQGQSPSCTDSDGGLAYDVAGYVEGVGPNGWPYTKYDECQAGGQIKEFWCNGTMPWPSFYQCPNGCVDGACVPETCTDDDGDGYAVEGGGCGLVDCDDDDPDVNPGADEVCDNGTDDDCNGLVDGEDPACVVCTDADGDGYYMDLEPATHRRVGQIFYFYHDGARAREVVASSYTEWLSGIARKMKRGKFIVDDGAIWLE